MTSRGWTAADVAVLPASLPALRTDEVSYGSSLGIRDGALVQTPSHLVGVVSGGRFRRIYDSRMVASYGYTGKPRLMVPTAVVLAMPTAALTAR
jgi:hypothetical protein